MRTFTLFLVCISTCFLSFSQDKPKDDTGKSVAKNTIFGEFLSNSLVYSVNYDRILINKEKWKFTGRLGIGYFFDRYNRQSIFDFPSEFTFLIGKQKHFFETGLGVTYVVITAPKEHYSNLETEHYSYLNSRFGYRYQRPQGGFFFKAGLNVVGALTENSRYTFYYSEFIWVYGGVGIGYTFKPRKK